MIESNPFGGVRLTGEDAATFRRQTGLDKEVPMQPETKSFRGSYLLFRKTPQGLKRKVGAGRPPKFRHQTFDAAEAEAQRLLGQFPESTFIIMQEVARVKMKPVEGPCVTPSAIDETQASLSIADDTQDPDAAIDCADGADDVETLVEFTIPVRG